MSAETKRDTRSILDQNAFNFARSSGNDHLDSLIRQRRELVGPTSMLFYDQPIEMVEGQGVWLFDAEGKRYLDVYNNVPVLGHCHPRVIDAVAQQMVRLNVHTRYLDEALHRYAEQLLGTLPLDSGRLVMTCTGSEANDLALRLARLHSGKQGVIVSAAAYHGNTAAVTEVSPSSMKQGQVPDFVVCIDLEPLNDESLDAAAYLDTQVANAIELLDERGFGCAALLIDTIFSSDGVYADPAGALAPAVRRVQHAGGLLIADEVQPGFGRTGSEFWGFARHGLMPDIVTFGKPMGNGYPVAGLAAPEALLAELAAQTGYFNTFGGSSVAVAAAQAVLDTLVEEELQANALSTGNELLAGLSGLCDEFPQLARVRGAGLFIGVDIVAADNQPDPLACSRIINALRHRGVLIGAAGLYGNVLKIRPPLCFKPEHGHLLLEQLRQVLINDLGGVTS
ncbi:aspartate aminotransferase family protein [Marinobacterium mangrovicola]|uniref:4-aminobutyrate aminotransferase-like enzyme n=1 Tax=Marinobacterium mangrovicola TaxID=1476959 RepID=A0A4R1GJ88_9GAMM|nr:aminotransferase class III-fold pyridoxal phosphate-dependent enzyme [Marinobacterium mangrovicola]TCK07193.1 4-aminobutyrate aminotransferase-like enzyme [Marinobacterium mangrovicola]